MEAAEVDEGVGAEEKVGDDGSNGVQLSWNIRTFVCQKDISIIKNKHFFESIRQLHGQILMFGGLPIRMKHIAMM